MAKRKKRKIYVCECLETRTLLAATITSNTTTNGNIAIAGQNDSYEFTASAGDRIILSVGEGALATPTFDPQLQLIGTTGTVIGTNAGATSAYVEMSAPTTGTYNVVVRELNNNTTGDYRLHFDLAPNPGAVTDPADGDGKLLTPNSTTSAAIATVGDIDLYSFTAAVGDRIILSMGEGDSAAATFDPNLSLYGPAGNQIATDSTANSAYIEVTATTAGTYSVLAREFNNNATGDYRLHFEKAPFIGNATDPADGDGRTLASNTTTSAAIATVGDVDYYTFSAAAGDDIILSVGEGAAATATFEPYIALYSPTGAQLQTNISANSAYIEFSTTVAGTYGVLVREYNDNTTGDYKLYFDKAPQTGAATDPDDGDGKVLSSNTTTAANIASFGDLDAYTFNAAVGDHIILSVGEGAAATATFEPYLALYSPTGVQLKNNTAASSAYIETSVTVAGTYTVLVREYNNNTTGDYRLHFEQLPFTGNSVDPADGDGGTLTPNSTTNGAIGTIGDLDLYSFNAAVGDHMVISLGEGSAVSATFEPNMAVFGPTGTLIKEDVTANEAFVEFDVTVAGTYNVFVREYNDNTVGNYRLYFEKLPFGGSPTDPADGDGSVLTPNTTTHGAIATVGDLDVYKFNAASGDRIILSVGEGVLAQATFDPDMFLFGPNGAQLKTASGAAAAYIETTATVAGTYTVLIRETQNNVTGDYRLYFERLPFAGASNDPADGDGQTLVSNTTVNTSIGAPGDIDLYDFTASAGDSFIVSAGDTSGTVFTPYVALYNPDGTLNASDTGAGGASINLLTATVAGVYRVMVIDNTDANTGNYALHFIKVPGPQPTDPNDQDLVNLASNQPLSAAITAGDLDPYLFNLPAGGNATIRVGEIGTTGFTPEIDVFGPNGTRLATNTNASLAVVTLTNVAAAGLYTVVVRDSGDDTVGQYSIALNASPAADTRLPVVIDNHFDYNGDRQQIVFLLSEGIGGTLETSDLVLQNLTSNTTIPAASVSAIFNPLNNQVVFRFPGYSAGVLPDGNYHATLSAGSLTDTSGNPLASESSFDFFVLAGDANRDRSVGFADLVAVAQHYGTPGGANFNQGDFDYDGAIGFSDLVIVAQHYGATLPAPAGAAVAAEAVEGAPVFATSTLATSDADSDNSRQNKAIFSVTPIDRPAPAQPKSPPRVMSRK